MSQANRAGQRATLPLVRCAIYTRKSTEEGLEQEFNSLDAQRESAEAFVRSQAGEGWTVLPDRYDDGGFTGGNMERPALKRLMADVAAGKVDCTVVYKVDRLSRSLLDFARILEAFETHHVSFVSVTQQINSATSMGRLMLNVLLSFAQFEREIIAERTRDKIAATRRKGKWSGGRPLLGYDVDPRGQRLAVNPEEAERVRDVFGLFLEHESLPAVARELEARGWTNKRWRTRAGKDSGGEPFSKVGVRRLLTNVLYIGKVRYKEEVHDGEQAAVVDPAVFRKTQELLRSGRRTDRAPAGNGIGALLRGLLRCVPCGCAMTPAHSAKGVRRYRYYTCTRAQKRGWDACPSKSLPADEIEQLVLDRIRGLGREPVFLREMLAQARGQEEVRAVDLEAEQRGLERDLTGWQAEVRNLSLHLRPGQDNNQVVAHLAELQERIGQVEGRVRKVREQIHAIHHRMLGDDEATTALSLFDPLWGTLTPAEQTRVVGLLVERVDYDGAKGKVTLSFHPTGIRALADEWAARIEERRMNPLSIECEVHFNRCGRGRKELEAGAEASVSTPGRVPRVTRLLALAHRLERLRKTGVVKDYTEAACLGHVTRARVSQVMSLLLLAPDLQEQILFLPRSERGRDPIILHDLLPIAAASDWKKQRRMWTALTRR